MSRQAPEHLTEASASTLAKAIRERKVSSLEVIDAHLKRIEAVNPKLNAVVQLAGEARDQARDADTAIARRDTLGPLHGVPFTVKDWIETEGLICAAGHNARAEFVPKRDATVRRADAGGRRDPAWQDQRSHGQSRLRADAQPVRCLAQSWL